MQLSFTGIQDKAPWQAAGIRLPGYDVVQAAQNGQTAPRWAHFGVGNIFRVFLGSIGDALLESGAMDGGITCVETFDPQVIEKIYTPFDNLGLNVILRSDGTRDCKVIGAFAQAIQADYTQTAQWQRLQGVFAAETLQLVSFTITEKGYALQDETGAWLPGVAQDLKNGPEKATCAMAVLTAMLLHRYKNGATPLALVSMDNCSRNGSRLKASVCAVAEEWVRRGFAPPAFADYLADETRVAFPWTMIDKITPRPSEKIAADLQAAGLSDMAPVITERRTYIAPFVNAEGPQYLVIEDRFPNGRPPLEQGAGVYLTDRSTVNRAERMKVTALLNPVHSATGPIGVLLGIEGFAEMLHTRPEMLRMAKKVAYDEGMPMVEDPGILSPKAFVDELFAERFPNVYLGDTNLRLSTDVSQGVGVRFGETIQAYRRKWGTAAGLTAIPLGIAGWLRYMMGVDDFGNRYELAPDPMNETIGAALSTVRLGAPESLTTQLRPILQNEAVFCTDLYDAGVGEKIEGMLREMLAGPGAVAATVCRYMHE